MKYFIGILLIKTFLFTSGQSNQERWFDYHGVSITDFKKMPTSKFSIDVLCEFTCSDETKFEVYKPLFIYSPNKSKYLDLDSYILDIEKEGDKLVSYGGTVDTEVNLIDTQKSK